ncbi:hypothetical protein CHU98_g7626 [Xylaria longipes]|nr:hypothetical protein CHU98_g7626 [Xylaria longipes]
MLALISPCQMSTKAGWLIGEAGRLGGDKDVKLELGYYREYLAQQAAIAAVHLGRYLDESVRMDIREVG